MTMQASVSSDLTGGPDKLSLNWKDEPWYDFGGGDRVIDGGYSAFVEKLVGPVRKNIMLNTKVTTIRWSGKACKVSAEDGKGY